MREPRPLRGAIVAMTRDRVIGANGRLPWHYREDMLRFKRRTMGSAVLMGRVTWDSLNRKPLPGRRNIVLSRAGLDGIENYDGIAAAIAACEDADFWVIGGEQIYRAALPSLNLLDVTTVPDVVEGKKLARFPEVELGEWEVVGEEELQGGLRSVVYRRVGQAPSLP
ncbi:MAG: Dihydrofolate reductase [Arenicellales bacterium IbO2]|nr:dihydrofolate reductase [Gammaproteobacteria bacterium]MDA8023733.1 dihydrofolate reductase [Gammaproteobacteria bacterium]CAJ2376228.1 MAG: Dihydrofolate reductase [Arenicellales bacterium IbO2]